MPAPVARSKRTLPISVSLAVRNAAPTTAAWNGPISRAAAFPTIPGTTAYVYRSPGEHGPYDIMSYGSDGQEGGSGVAADLSLENVTAKNE